MTSLRSRQRWYNVAGLYNTESSKNQIDQHIFAAGRKVYFISLWFGRNSGTTIIIRSQALATLPEIEKALAGRKKRFRGPNVVQV